MEQYLQHSTRMKRKNIMNSHFHASVNSFNSWEEQALAEDSHGPIGGFAWPPRSYSCSFCRRKFRSAQALGGHMNVHRRDKARLKQSLSPQYEFLHQQNHSQSLFKPSLDKNTRKQGNDAYVETNLCVGLNLAVSREEVIKCKRQKITILPLPIFLKPCSNGRYSFQSEVVGVKNSNMEDMDLELRLGGTPTVKYNSSLE